MSECLINKCLFFNREVVLVRVKFETKAIKTRKKIFRLFKPVFNHFLKSLTHNVDSEF